MNVAKYHDHMIQDTLLSGINDDDTHREILFITNIIEKSLNNAVALVESKKMACHAVLVPCAIFAGIPTFKWDQSTSLVMYIKQHVYQLQPSVQQLSDY